MTCDQLIYFLEGRVTLSHEELTALLTFLGTKGWRLKELQALGVEARKRPTGDPYTDSGPDSWKRVGTILRPVGFLPVTYGPSTYFDEQDDTERLSRALGRLGEIALSPEESLKLIEERLKGVLDDR